MNSLGISFSSHIHNLCSIYSSHKNEREVVVWLLAVFLCFRGFGRRTGSTDSPTGKFRLQLILPLTRTETRFRDDLGGRIPVRRKDSGRGTGRTECLTGFPLESSLLFRSGFRPSRFWHRFIPVWLPVGMTYDRNSS